MKLRIFITTLLFGTLSYGEPLKQNLPITEPAFSQLIYQAYVSPELVNKDGSFTFPRGFHCLLEAGTPKCELLANEWNQTVEGPGRFRGRMFTPVTEDAIFDLMEYMNVQPEILDEGNGVQSRTKTLAVTVQDKEYSLICTEVTMQGRSDFFSNCVLYNGI